MDGNSQPGDDKRNEAAQLEYMLQAYQERLVNINEQIESIMSLVQKLNMERELLENFNQIKNKSMMVNVGNALFLDGKAGGVENVVVGIGAKFAIEKDAPSALELIKIRIEKITGNLNAAIAEKKKTESFIYDISYKLEQLVG